MDRLQEVTVKHLNGKAVDDVGQVRCTLHKPNVQATRIQLTMSRSLLCPTQMVIKTWADPAIQASLRQIRSVTFEDDLVYQSAAM